MIWIAVTAGAITCINYLIYYYAIKAERRMTTLEDNVFKVHKAVLEDTEKYIAKVDEFVKYVESKWPKEITDSIVKNKNNRQN
jgi:hypothetical protein